MYTVWIIISFWLITLAFCTKRAGVLIIESILTETNILKRRNKQNTRVF